MYICIYTYTHALSLYLSLKANYLFKTCLSYRKIFIILIFFNSLINENKINLKSLLKQKSLGIYFK